MCALGQTAGNPVLTTLRYFRHEYEAHILDKRCPAGVCKSLIRYVVLAEKCTGCQSCKKACPNDCIKGTLKDVHLIDQIEVHQVRRLQRGLQVRGHRRAARRSHPDHLRGNMITFRMNGLEVKVEEGSTLLDAAKFYGLEIPTLCHNEG